MPCCRSFHFSTVADFKFVSFCSGTFNSSSSAVICCSIAAFALPVALVALLSRSLLYALISCMSFSTAATNSSFSFFAAFPTAPTASLACCLTSPAPVFGSGTPSFLLQAEIPTASPRTINHDKRRFIWKLLAFGLLEFPRCTGARLAPFETGCATLDRLAQLAPFTSLPAIVFVAAHCHIAVLAVAHHHRAAHATHRLHVFVHGLHVLLHQLLAFLRVGCRPEFFHLLLHVFHFLLHLGHVFVHVHAHRRLVVRVLILR